MRDATGRYSAVFDFFVPKHRAVVEVNGTFWHSDPRFFPDGPVHESQHRTARAWARKLALIRAAGNRLYVVWEHDIKQRGNEYLASVLTFI